MGKQRSARIYRGTSRNIAFLARQLRAGELVAVPTETVYGLAANALDAAACEKIFRAKRRPLHDPLIVHLFSAGELASVCLPNAAAEKLARRFWPGPLTMILPKRPEVPGIVSAGLPSVAVRVPSHPLFRRLLKQTGLPLAAPSANPFGYVSPTTAAHVQQGLGKAVRHILDGGSAKIGLESTIVDLRDPRRPRLLRPGAITQAQIAAALKVRVAAKATSGRKPRHEQRAEIAPGQLARHYSPRTPVVLHRALRRPAKGHADEAYVFLGRPRRKSGSTFWFDARGDLRGVARRLFATLRALDDGRFKAIHVELAPPTGLGVAINDRLRRAAAR